MKRPNLGQWCKVKRTARKRHHYVQRLTEWVPVNLTVPRDAIYIGFRSARNVLTQYDGDGFVTGWEFLTSREIWLFVSSERKNPIYVFPEDVEFNEEN